MPRLTSADLQALGLYDPRAPHAAQRLELIDYLQGLGATREDLLAYRDELPGLAAVVTIRGGRALTLAQAVARSGVAAERLLAIARAAGFPQPGAQDRVFGEQFVQLAAGLAQAEAVFGEPAVLQLVRVMGSAMARLADAMVSAFLVNVDPGISEDDPVGLRVAHANAAASQLLSTVGVTLEALLRQHLLAARRSSLGVPAGAAYETRHLCVGFVDLVESTALALHMTTSELGSLLTEFEHVALDAVTAAGGRVVKLIGDEVLYTANDELHACTVALRLTAVIADHPSLPPARAGVAGGEVMMRDGDVFGPVVNLAARAVKAAAPGEILTTAEVAAAARVAAEPVGARRLRGFAQEVELCRLLAG